MKCDADVIIAGGGMVGATLAAALGDSALRVMVIESQPAAMDQRVSAMTLATQAVFENLGVWDRRLADLASPIEAMRIWEGPSILRYDSADIGEPCLAWILENRAIVEALTERLRDFRNIEIVSPAMLARAEIGDDQVTVRLDNGQARSARLLVGADGAGSRVRSEAGIEWRRHDLAQTAIVASVQTEHSHQRVAWQHFLPTGPLAFLPLRDPNRVSIVWSADTGRATELMGLADRDFDAELHSAFGDSLGQVRLAGPRACYPLGLGFAHRYSSHRVALIGDAAHTVHPLAGQGVNLGILDAVTLAENLLKTNGRDCGQRPLLRRYERSRKGADLGMQLVTGGFRYLFGSSLAPVQAMRQAGLGFADRIPVFKNVVMRLASGLAGERPILARRSVPRSRTSL